jgi:hypothetical protein
MNNKDDIKLLTGRRDRLRSKIRTWKNEGRNALELIPKYEELVKQLEKLGVKTVVKVDYLTREYWENFNSSNAIPPDKFLENKIKKIEYRLSTLENSMLPKQISKKNKKTSKENTYILSLAWDDPVCSDKVDREELDQRLSDIRGYLEFLGLVKISTDANHLFDKTEYISKYEFSGDDNSFNIVKSSSNYLIDMFSKHENMNNLNISIYGKKRTF